jgi:phosphohistidine phosphatase SixA
MIVRTRRGEQTMELIFEQCDHNKQEEPCEECAPNKESEDNMDLYEYDYNKRIWF